MRERERRTIEVFVMMMCRQLLLLLLLCVVFCLDFVPCLTCSRGIIVRRYIKALTRKNYR